MGNNPDFLKDQQVVKAYNKHATQHLAGIPLFNVQDITFPLSTHGAKIVDATGRRVKLAGGNWSGAHMCRHCVDGLQFRKLRDIALDIRHKFKMNCIRLTYSLQMYFRDTIVQQRFIKANPQFKGLTGMQIFDITVQTLTQVGLMVILNNHTSSSQWCCSNQDGDGLWWSRQFPQDMFFQNCQDFAQRYRKNPRVIGMDLRNQLRKAHGLSASWGDGNPLTDWKRAAKICADKVQNKAPHWLILVSGLNYQLDLTKIHNSQLVLKIPNKLVYTGHFYGFSWVEPQITSWSMISYEKFRDRFFNTQTFVRHLGVPYFLGQYGNNCRDIPWQYLIRYLKQTDIDWTYWALDGFKCQPKQDQTYGVFTNNFQKARHPDLLQDMISVGPPPGTIIPKPNQPPAQKKVYIQRVSSIKQQPQQRRLQYCPPSMQFSQRQSYIKTQYKQPQIINQVIKPMNFNVYQSRNQYFQPQNQQNQSQSQYIQTQPQSQPQHFISQPIYNNNQPIYNQNHPHKNQVFQQNSNAQQNTTNFANNNVMNQPVEFLLGPNNPNQYRKQ